VQRQQEFLDHGFAFLKPMLLKDVADELGLHTSTVSRAVTNKWVHCPQGILELRQFFTLGFKTDSGEDISIHILKSRIRELMEKEDPAHPLSDSDLTDMLNRQGVEIKRRTVAKYREEMGIPNSRSRRVKT
jgi:RNA polymerase sigma-54 factor